MASNCTSCGGSHSGSNCYGQSKAVQQAIFPLLQNDCTGNSNTSINGCPRYFEPSTLTGSGCFTVPAVGATANLEVCDASVFRIGMWVSNPALGRYPIVGVNAATNLVTLRNSCDDGVTAIYGNPEPGTQICGTQSIWIGGESPCQDQEELCANVFNCLQGITEDNPLCLPDVPLTTADQCVYMLGLSAACDSGDCPQPDDPNCITKLNNVRFCEKTIVFQEGLDVAEDDACVRPVVITEDGNVVEAPAGAGVVKPTKVYLGQWSGGPGGAATLTAALNFSIDLSNFQVPDCAVGAILRPVYRYDFDDGAGDGPAFTTFLRAAGQPANNINYGINFVESTGGASSVDRPSSDALGGITVTFGPDKVVWHDYQDNGTSGNGNSVSVKLWLDAIIL